MPELPEIAYFTTYLQSTALHQPVRDVDVRETRVLGNVSGAQLRRELRGSSFTDAHRHGKYILAGIGDGRTLALHFGMTGSLAYYRDPGEEPEYARVVCALENGFHLAYISLRLLGRISLVRDVDAFLRAHDVGPDALSIEEDVFIERLLHYRGGLKSFFMNQKKLAGIGNIYADEILFQARRAPDAQAADIERKDAAKLYRVMRRVLTEAADRNADFSRYPRSWIAPRRGRKDASCPRGCGALRRDTVAGRTTYWCPACVQ